MCIPTFYAPYPTNLLKSVFHHILHYTLTVLHLSIIYPRSVIRLYPLIITYGKISYQSTGYTFRRKSTGLCPIQVSRLPTTHSYGDFGFLTTVYISRLINRDNHTQRTARTTHLGRSISARCCLLPGLFSDIMSSNDAITILYRCRIERPLSVARGKRCRSMAQGG